MKMSRLELGISEWKSSY